MGERPNILWFQTDEQRPDSLGCYGSTWAKTPNVDGLAARGTVLRNAVCQSPMCLPSRSSQLCGRYPQEFSCLNNMIGSPGFPPGYTTFPELLREAGYETVSVGRFHAMSKTVWERNTPMGDYLPQYTNYFHLNEAYDEREYHVVQRPGGGGHGLIVAGTYPGKENPCQITTDRAIEFLLRREPGDRPFMLLVGYNWPHTPTLAPPPFDRLYDPDSLPIRHYDALAYAGRARFDRMCADRHGMATLTRAQIRQVWKDYMGCCAYVDSEIGRVLGAVESQGLAADTIVLCSADHGKLLGEWGAGEKGTFDREVWRVPFIWSWPGRVPQNRIVDEPCELIDTARTLMTLAGVADRIPAAYRGRDLFAANGQPPGAAFGVIRPGRDEDPAFDPHFMRVAIRTARYRMDMNWRMDGSPAPAEKRDGNLFDLANDPFETRNLWSDASSAPVVEQLGGRISAWLSSTETDARLLDPANAGRIF